MFLLTAAGMVERRGWFRSSFVNHPTCFEVRFQATGECGFGEAIEKAVAEEYATWGDSWRTWKDGETGHVSPFHTEQLKPQEWRLADQGMLARNDVIGGNPGAMFNYVLKRDFYGPGYWVRVAFSRPLNEADKETLTNRRNAGYDVTTLPRPSVCGYGRLVESRKIEKPAGSQAVNLTNWAEGGDAFAAAFAKQLGPMFEAMSKNQQANTSAPVTPPTATPKQSKGNGGADSTPKRSRGAPAKKTTKQRADYARPLVDKGLTWPEIFERYAATAQGKADIGANADAMRLAYGREYPAK